MKAGALPPDSANDKSQAIAFRRQHVLEIAHSRIATIVDDELAAIDTDAVGLPGFMGAGLLRVNSVV